MRAIGLALLGILVPVSAHGAALVPIVPVPGAVSTTVYSINGSKQVAGSYIDADGNEHAFFGPYTGGYTTFDAGTGGTVARSISDSGYITGYANSQSNDAGAQPMFVRKPDGKILNVTRNGEILFGFSYGIEFATNTFAGAYWDPANHHTVAFLGRHGHWISDVDIPAVHQASAAYGYNSKGIVVGSFFMPPEHGFVVDGDTFTVVDYPDPHAVSTTLMSVNGDDIAVGQWRDGQDHAHSFLYDIDRGMFTDIKVKGAHDVQAWSAGDSVVVLTSDVGSFYWCRKKRGCPVGN